METLIAGLILWGTIFLISSVLHGESRRKKFTPMGEDDDD